eukprot:c9670_g1_i1 orf=143-2269(+)
MLSLLRGRFLCRRSVNSSSSSLTGTHTFCCNPSASSSSACTHFMSTSCDGVSMSLRVPDLTGVLPNSSPSLRKCYPHHKRVFSISSPHRCFLPIRSIMTERQDYSNGAPHTDEHEAPVRSNLRQMNIFLRSYNKGDQKRTLCPVCQGGNSREKCLSINISDDGAFAKWQCFRATCGWKGYTEAPRNNVRAGFQVLQESKALKKELSEESLRLQELSAAQRDYLYARGITEQTLNRNGVKQLRKGLKSMLAFPYKEGGEIVSCKYYTSDFDFEEEKCIRKIFYGLDDIKDASQIVIVGQELDKLALEEAGILNCVSVPDVPDNVRTKASDRRRKTEDEKFEYLWNCQDYLAKVDSFILATGSDDRSKNLAEELARRLGRERCWRVNWPVDNPGTLCKDATEVLQFKGHKALQDMITNAELYPIRGLFQFCDFDKEMDDYYHERLGNEQGVSTGWRSLDPLYRVVPGELTLITGIPSSGKSEWIDALLCNLSRQKNWSFALCSMENQVKEHGRKLLEKFLQKPFFNATYSSGTKKMSEKEFEFGKSWLARTFYLIRCENDELPSIQWVLDVAKSAVMRYGVRGLVIDPYNELDHQRPPNMTETEYVSQMLTKIKRFAQHHECHVWFVAHPKQLQGWRGDAPSLYDISGSAHFVNKCDVGIVVHRNRDPAKGPIDQVQIYVRKVRNKAAGMIGDAVLDYDRATGEYKDYIV